MGRYDSLIQFDDQIDSCLLSGMVNHDNHIILMIMSMQTEYAFFKYQTPCPKSNEVLVEVHAASLNFRDVMLSLGALPNASFECSLYGHNLGIEASGVVKGIGEGVNHLKPGDQVVVSGPACFASKITAHESRVQKLTPGTIGLDDAAALPSIYCTAYHALVQLACVKKGEKVLIHAAAGGVGHAAVNICKYLEAEIFVTVSSPKREYCILHLGIDESHIFESRDTCWFEGIMKATSNNGVDVVLNSLAGEHQRLGLESLKPGGRFCEIGKVDIFSNGILNQYLLRKNIGFFAIDMDRMNLENPGKATEITKAVLAHIAKGDFGLIPLKKFPMSQLHNALQYMKTGAHIGKVLLTNHDSSKPITIQCREPVCFGPESNIFILGGAGGFGSRLVEWAFKLGARKFTVTVSKDPHRVTDKFEDLIAKGATFHVLQVDLKNEDELRKIEDFLTNPNNGPVEAMIHCAGIFENFKFDEEIPENVLDRQADIKNRTAMVMHKISMKVAGLKYFIIIGSASMEVPAHFMTSYAATNSMLAGLSRFRESVGLPCTTLHMTSLKDVGLVQKDEKISEFQNLIGIEAVSSNRALDTLETMLSMGISNLLHYQYFSPEQKRVVHAHSYETYGTSAISENISFGLVSSDNQKIKLKTYEDAVRYLESILLEILGISEASPTRQIGTLGVDSIKMIEIGRQLKQDLGYSVDPTVFTLTLGDLASHIFKSVASTSV